MAIFLHSARALRTTRKRSSTIHSLQESEYTHSVDPSQPSRKKLFIVLVTLVAASLAVSAIEPHDFLTWFLEVAPVLVAVVDPPEGDPHRLDVAHELLDDERDLESVSRRPPTCSPTPPPPSSTHTGLAAAPSHLRPQRGAA